MILTGIWMGRNENSQGLLQNAVIPLRFLISFLPKGSAPKQRDVIDGNVLQCELCENRIRLRITAPLSAILGKTVLTYSV